MRIRDVLELYCADCSHNKTCWKPCSTVTTAVLGGAMSEVNLHMRVCGGDSK